MELISRLFDHKPAIQGELVFFIDEFEKKLDLESNIFVDAENLSRNLLEYNFPSCEALMKEDVIHLRSKVDDCWKLSQRVLELDQSVLEDVSTNVDEEDGFLESIKKQKQAILKNFDESINNLNEEYQKMKKQLERENSPSK